MSENILNIRMVQKHDIKDNWDKAVNFIPKQGEIIVYDADINFPQERFKIGDGITPVSELPFSANGPISTQGNPVFAEVPAGTSIVAVSDIAHVQAGTGVPGPSNIRSITGWDNISLTHHTKNIFGGLALAQAIVDKVPNAYIDYNAKTVTYKAEDISKIVIFEGFKPEKDYTIILKRAESGRTAGTTANMALYLDD